jgi:hypothetical protein
LIRSGFGRVDARALSEVQRRLGGSGNRNEREDTEGSGDEAVFHDMVLSSGELIVLLLCGQYRRGGLRRELARSANASA